MSLWGSIWWSGTQSESNEGGKALGAERGKCTCPARAIAAGQLFREQRTRHGAIVRQLTPRSGKPYMPPRHCAQWSRCHRLLLAAWLSTIEPSIQPAKAAAR